MIPRNRAVPRGAARNIVVAAFLHEFSSMPRLTRPPHPRVPASASLDLERFARTRSPLSLCPKARGGIQAPFWVWQHGPVV
jgi:hypothetical protein